MRGAVDVIDVDTAFFMGNYPHNYEADAEIAFQGLTAAATRDRKMGTNDTSKEIKLVERLKSPSNERRSFRSQSQELAGYPETRHNLLRVARCKRGPWTHIRLNMLPDGGIARLRVFGEVVIDWMHIKSSEMIF
ncbi:hypothetical protein PsorP6_009328 [Peronosclerospora sorghi]|uniref:Uncharacterized protein n=1 Tax=Peronosclerospora sorghi TaxID=230839 RepID=A0ACC0VZH2_9STRA|nr:hypothetical protein PsorP6_009328 [Peronosclerospora sorghi]